MNRGYDICLKGYSAVMLYAVCLEFGYGYISMISIVAMFFIEWCTRKP